MKNQLQPPTEVGGIFKMRLDSSRISGIGKQPGPKGPGFLPPVKLGSILYFFAFILFSQGAYAFGDRVDIFTYGGYDQVSDISITNSTLDYGTFKGINAGGALLIALSSSPISPIIGGGVHYSMTTGTVAVSSTSNKDYTITSTTGVGHFGFRLGAPILKLYLFGNLGYGSDDTFESKSTTTIHTYTITEHLFYGGTAALLISTIPFLRFGLSSVYNIHKTKFNNDAVTPAESNNLNYKELSVNFVVDINL